MSALVLHRLTSWTHATIKIKACTQGVNCSSCMLPDIVALGFCQGLSMVAIKVMYPLLCSWCRGCQDIRRRCPVLDLPSSPLVFGGHCIVSKRHMVVCTCADINCMYIWAGCRSIPIRPHSAGGNKVQFCVSMKGYLWWVLVCINQFWQRNTLFRFAVVCPLITRMQACCPGCIAPDALHAAVWQWVDVKGS